MYLNAALGTQFDGQTVALVIVALIAAGFGTNGMAAESRDLTLLAERVWTNIA